MSEKLTHKPTRHYVVLEVRYEEDPEDVMTDLEQVFDAIIGDIHRRMSVMRPGVSVWINEIESRTR